MRTSSEINAEIKTLSESLMDNEHTPYVMQALAWVLGEEPSACEMLQEETEE